MGIQVIFIFHAKPSQLTDSHSTPEDRERSKTSNFLAAYHFSLDSPRIPGREEKVIFQNLSRRLTTLLFFVVFLLMTCVDLADLVYRVRADKKRRKGYEEIKEEK